MNNSREVVVVYDKQCPVCDAYTNLVRIRQSVGRLTLVDAREDAPIMDEITAKGLDLDQGMVVKIGDELYYGADAIHILALLGTRESVFNRLAYWLFRSPAVARSVYPVLRGCRNLLLKALGKTKINNLGLTDNERF